MPDRTWTWGSVAPDEWFTDRANESMLVRGYLTARAEVPAQDTDDALWTYTFRDRDFAILVRRGAFDVPRPVEMRYVGGGNLAPVGVGEIMSVPQGTYLLLVTPIAAQVHNIDVQLEEQAGARLDAAAGLVAATLSPNAVYLAAFEFFQAATGSEVSVMGPRVRNTQLSPVASLTDGGMRTIKGALDAVGAAKEKLQSRVRLSLRWYANAHQEPNRIDSFVKFWIALEALTMGNGKPTPLAETLGHAYGHDTKWAQETFAINGLSSLRNDIVHGGKQPRLHGNVLRLVAALYEDALLAKLRLPAEERARQVLPDGEPFRLRQWRESGDVVTVRLPAADAPGGG